MPAAEGQKPDISVDLCGMALSNPTVLASGILGISKEMLQRVAEATDALYFRATDTTGLRQIYSQINRMEKSEVEVQVFTRYKELAGWVLFPAMGLLLLDLLLRRTLLRTLP